MSFEKRRVLIVTPSFNGAAFIDETIYSVVTQATDIEIHYHVQDGGSSDGTLDKLRTWSDLIERGTIPQLCRNLHFTYRCERDAGMYDAINTGFLALKPAAADILTWINSDDRLAPGVVATLAQVFDDVPDCEFLSGRVSLMNEAGSILGVSPATGYARACLAAGLHDGRKLDFIMQEGTFFSGRIWNAVKGVDSRFRLAGDWDLWRRLAAEATHYTLDSVTGFHRRRQGQLSGDMDRYYGEVDSALSGFEDERAVVFSTAAQLGADAPDAFKSNLIRFDSISKHWIPITFNPHGSIAPGVTTVAGYADTYSLALTDGVFPREGPYPEYGLPGSIRWMSKPTMRGTLSVPTGGRYKLRLLMRASRRNLRLEISVNGQSVLAAPIPDPLPMRNETFEVPLVLHAGSNDLVLSVLGSGSEQRRLLVIEAFAVEERSKVLQPPEWFVPSSPMVSRTCCPGGVVVVAKTGNRPDLLRDTVASVRAQRSDTVSLVVCATEGAAVAAALQELRDQIDIVLPATAWEEAQVDRLLEEMRAHVVITLEVGDMLPSGALDAALRALDRPGVDAVSGLTDIRDRAGKLLGRHLAIANEPGVIARRVSGQRNAEVPVGHIQLGRSLLVRGCETQTVPTIVQPRLDVLIVEPGAGRFLEGTPLQNLATTFAKLGAKVRYINAGDATPGSTYGRICFGELEARTSGAPESIEDILAPPAFELMMDASGTCSSSGAGQGNIFPIDPRMYVDTVALAPRTKWRARQLMALPPVGFIIAVAADAYESALCAVRCVLEGLAGGDAIRLVSFCRPGEPILTDRAITALGEIGDDLTLSYAFSGVDLLVMSRADARLRLKAEACGLPVLLIDDLAIPKSPDHSDGEQSREAFAEALEQLIADPLHREALGLAARQDIEAYHSLEAAAIHLHRSANFLPPDLALRLRASDRIDGHDLQIGVAAGNVPPSLTSAIIRLVPSIGSKSPPDDPSRVDQSHGVLVEGDEAAIFVDLPRFAGEAVRLKLSGQRMDTGRCRLNHGPWIAFSLETGSATLDVFSGCVLEPGLHRLEVLRDPSSISGVTREALLITHASLLSSTTTVDEEEAAVSPGHLGGRYSKPLLTDGDWHYGEGFHGEESAYPGLGLYESVRWSKGLRCSLRTRVRFGARRQLCIAVTGMLPSQQLRPIIDGVAASFCDPLDGVVGRIHHLTWMVDMPEGDLEIEIELSACRTSSDARDIGIIILGVLVGAPTSTKIEVPAAPIPINSEAAG